MNAKFNKLCAQFEAENQLSANRTDTCTGEIGDRIEMSMFEGEI